MVIVRAKTGHNNHTSPLEAYVSTDDCSVQSEVSMFKLTDTTHHERNEVPGLQPAHLEKMAKRAYAKCRDENDGRWTIGRT